MMKHSIDFLAISLSSLLLLAGCATPQSTTDVASTAKAPLPTPVITTKDASPMQTAPPPSDSAKPTEVPIELSEGEKNLASAIATFDRGEYALAIRQLKPLTTDSTLNKAAQLRALKSLAFSQCLSRAITACRQTFEHAFRLDDKFDLAPAERGHPVWGPQFERARKAVAASKGK